MSSSTNRIKKSKARERSDLCQADLFKMEQFLDASLKRWHSGRELKEMKEWVAQISRRPVAQEEETAHVKLIGMAGVEWERSTKVTLGRYPGSFESQSLVDNGKIWGFILSQMEG